MSEYIDELGRAITAMHECGCSHFGSEKVIVKHKGEIVREGDVEVFQLDNHPEAKIACGWGWKNDDGEIR